MTKEVLYENTIDGEYLRTVTVTKEPGGGIVIEDLVEGEYGGEIEYIPLFPQEATKLKEWLIREGY